MSSRVFSTVADALLEYAEAAAVYFENLGYKVYPEKNELGFPYTPTFLCKRHSTTIIAEVFNTLPKHRKRRIDVWISYARSCTGDTRIAVCLPQRPTFSQELEDSLRQKGAGLYTVQGVNVIERIPPSDLALNVKLPELDKQPRKVQRLLGPAYEQFSRSQWREGFEEACQALEVETRRYLKAGVKSGRITVMGVRGPRNLTSQRIDQMTMGQLVNAFSSILNVNSLDARIGQVLAAINADRVGVAHHKSKKRTEKSLRANVGQHMWKIAMVMRDMV